MSGLQVILHLIAISKKRPFLARLIDTCEQLEGAYSLVFLSEDKVVAVRDPHGFRPLVMGRKSNGAYVFASETCALDLIEAEYVREVSGYMGLSRIWRCSYLIIRLTIYAGLEKT